jgi:FKBP-type peptidyl-prolyl cis-trans isomerase
MKSKILVWACCALVAFSCKQQELALSAEQQMAIDLGIIDRYLADNGISAVQHPSGLRYVIHTQGTGEKPTSGDCIRVNYAGRILFETQPFDSNPFLGWPLPNFILGWRIGLKEIGVGGSITLYIPSGLGYGTIGSKSGDTTIPPNSILVFDVDLLNITKYNAAGQYCYPWP